MYGVNKVILVGTTGKDNKVTDFTNGGKVVSTTLATTKKGFSTANGNSVPDKTEWHNIVFHDGLAKVAEKYIKKGTNLYIEGELRTRKYENNGTTYYNTEVHVTEMHMLPSGQKREETAQNTAQKPTSTSPVAQNSKDDDPFNEENHQSIYNTGSSSDYVGF